MSNSWLDYPTTSNLFKQSYIKEFIDISGDLYVRNNNISGINSDISMNGTLTCNSLTLTESTGAGINGDVQTALDGKQDILTSGGGIDITCDTISAISSGGGVDTLTENSSSVINGFNLELDLYSTSYESQYSTGGFGYGTRISDDGNTILIGMPYLDDPIGGTNNISAMVAYRNTNGTWAKLGTHVFGDGRNNQIPHHGDLDISADGQYIVHCSYQDNDNSNFGFVVAYKLVGNSWVQHGNTMLGTPSSGTSHQLGNAVLITNNGNTIIVSHFADNLKNIPLKLSI